MTTTAQLGGSYIGMELSADLAAAALDLARRFHDGATLWVMSPQWEPHAHHVAVEFVHPVIMGKRALPSVALVGPDPVAQVRVASQPGDLLIAVASAEEPAVVDAMRRASACRRPSQSHSQRKWTFRIVRSSARFSRDASGSWAAHRIRAPIPKALLLI